MACEKSKILVFGGTGYLGLHMVKASLSMGHPTYAYVRPVKPYTNPSKLDLLKEFESMGVTVFQVNTWLLPLNIHKLYLYLLNSIH
jgi:nucleoside-diphosphate-sugar epimerase